jgi:hypothetical protein
MSRHQAHERPAVLFAALCKFAFQLPAPVGMIWWTGLQRCPDAKVQWIYRRLRRFSGADYRYGGWFTEVIPAKSLVEATEVLYAQGWLPRLEATQIEEAILDLVEWSGNWRLRTKETKDETS